MACLWAALGWCLSAHWNCPAQNFPPLKTHLGENNFFGPCSVQIQRPFVFLPQESLGTTCGQDWGQLPKPFFFSFSSLFPTVQWLCIGRREVEHCLSQTILEVGGEGTSLGRGRCFWGNALLLSSVLSSSKVGKGHHFLTNWAPTLKENPMYLIPDHQDTNSKWSHVSGSSSPLDTS